MFRLSPDTDPTRRSARGLRGWLLPLLALFGLLAVPPVAGALRTAPVVVAHADDCPLPPDLCPPSNQRPTPRPRPTPPPATPTPAPPTSSPAPASTPASASTPKPAATPKVTPPTPRPATDAPPPAAPPAATAPPAAKPPASTPAPVPPLTGVVPESRTAVPVHAQIATVVPEQTSGHAWEILLALVAAAAVCALVVLRSARQRRRAALHARYNRMRAERGLLPLTPKQIDFISRGRSY